MRGIGRGRRRRQPRSGCRPEATATQDRTPSLPPTAPGMCGRISVEAMELLVLPVTTTIDWQRTTSVLSTVCTRARTGTGIGCGYGILQLAADRDPSPPPPASRSQPPLSSTDSDDDMSDITVVDIGLETDVAVIGIDRYSDVSEPGSPTAAASLDRAAAMASATLSSSAAAVSERSGPSCGVGPSALGAVISPDWTHPPDPGTAVYPAPEVPVLGTEGSTSIEDAVLDAANDPDQLEIPTFGDLVDPSGEGLSATPEGTSDSLPCGQRIVTPESNDPQDSSFEVISDTDSESDMTAGQRRLLKYRVPSAARHRWTWNVLHSGSTTSSR